MISRLALPVGAAVIFGFASLALAGPERVEFPTHYKQTYSHFKSSDRTDNNQVRELFANNVALLGAARGGPLPSGAKLAMEIYKAEVDASGEPVLDENGNLIKGPLVAITAMEKHDGWGAAYSEDIRNGDWDFALFTPDGQHKPGANIRPCMECHLPYADDDYVIYREDLDATARR